MIPLALALSFLSPPPAMPHRIHPEIQQYVDQHVIPAMAAIPAERKESLDLIAAFIRERRDSSATADLTFICTHNSRRSILSQVWAATAACAFGLDHVRTFSGGTEATAFNPRAIEALRRAGFHVAVPKGENPRCTVAISKERATEPCWSKRYDDPANPQQGFCAVMTCSEADKNCPIVFGALDRVSLPYRDPKEADGTAEETARYDERCLQIAAEMWYVMQQVAYARNSPVIATGAMRNTMFNGQLAGLIQLDSLAKPGMYGIGPLEYLRGEVLLLDGTVFVSEAVKDGGMSVKQHSDARAPFFVHQHVTEWSDVELPDSVVDLPTLDAFLTARFAATGQPFAFRLSGPISSVDVHIVDVPLGSAVSGPDDAHRHNKHFHREGGTMELLGFFSTRHKAVFTHHDTNIHVHAISAERDWMGHVETLRFEFDAMRLLVGLPH